MLTRTRTTLAAAVVPAVVVLSTGGCEAEPTSSEKAAADRNAAVDNIRKAQPVEAMDYSPTLATINRWAATWGQEGAVAYVYMRLADGSYDGYYVLDGLPVNYCVGGSPSYDLLDPSGDGVSANLPVPAPGLDGAYYGGCDASRYYGFDAVTGRYLEYTDGFIMTAVVTDQPLPLEQQPPAYASSIADVEKAR